ncbi:MAG: endonuclease/exonuclease/phosphatase family protein [Clostridia bacterium]|nr:endonuclease/exonuclease/phosphatase family protein [Clostridia bacterium]
MKLKVLTYNIRSGHPADREDKAYYYDLSKVTEEIRFFSPDFFGLNEVDNHQKRTNFDNQTAIIAKSLEFPHFYFSKATDLGSSSSEYGNAVVSKFPIVFVETILPPEPPRDDELYYEQRGIAHVVLELPNGRQITLLQTHFGLNVGERQNMLTVLLRMIDEIKTPLILMGDFNMRPYDWLLNPVRERLTEVTEALGMMPKTYPSYDRGHPDCKIDYIFVSRHFQPICAEVKQTQASDHYPYYAELELLDNE